MAVDNAERAGCRRCDRRLRLRTYQPSVYTHRARTFRLSREEMTDLAGARGFFAPDVDKTVIATWTKSLGAAVVEDADDAEYCFSDDANDEVTQR